MSLRNEQCNKVCRILDDVLANRPTERDSLITAVRKAFGALETEPQWIPCSERLPERPERVQIQMKNSWIITGYYDGEAWYSVPDDGVSMDDEYVKAWTHLPEPYKGES